MFGLSLEFRTKSIFQKANDDETEVCEGHKDHGSSLIPNID